MKWGEYEIHARTPSAGGGFDAVASHRDRALRLWVGAEGLGSPDAIADVAQRLSRVYQANLPRVLGSDFVEGRAVLRVAPQEGRTLSERLRDGELAVPESIDAIQSVGAALVKLHRAGIVHGAVDEAEVFFADGGPVFLLHGGMMPFLETRKPRSPEAHGTDVRDEAGDVFGLARLLARLSIGVDPFEAPTGSAPAAVVREDQLPRELPEGFRRFLTRSLAIDPSARIRRADEFAADLRVIRASWASSAPERRASPGPARLAVAVAVLVAGVWAWSRGCSP